MVSLKQDELLAHVVADLAALRQEHDPGEPLLAGEVDLAGEGVQMANRRRRHFLQTRVRRVVVPRQDLGQQFVECAFFGHRDPPSELTKMCDRVAITRASDDDQMNVPACRTTDFPSFPNYRYNR